MTLGFSIGRGSRLATFAMAACFGVLTSSVASAAIIYSTGFENPPFTLGPVLGQDGWGSTGTVDVQSFAVNGGTQALDMLGDATGPRALHVTPIDGLVSPVVLIQTDMVVPSQFTTTWSLLAVSSTSTVLGGFDILPDGTLQLETAGLPTAGTITLDAWNTFGLVLDYTTSTFAVYLNGVPVSVGNPFLAAGTDLLAGMYATATAGSGVAFVDNYLVATQDASVPEPGAFLLAATGIGLIALRRLRGRR